MQRPRDIVSGGLISFIYYSLVLLVIVGVISDLKLYDGSTSAETPNPTKKKFEERAPLGVLPATSSRTLSRPTAKSDSGHSQKRGKVQAAFGIMTAQLCGLRLLGALGVSITLNRR